MIRRLAWVLFHQGVGRGSVFLFFALLPRWIPLDAVGRFALLYAGFLLVVQPLFETAVTSLLVRAASRGDEATVHRLLTRSLLALLPPVAAAALLAATGSLPPAVGWLAGAFALSVPMQLAFAVARGRERFDLEGIAGTLQKGALLPLAALLARAGVADERMPAMALAASMAVGAVALGLLGLAGRFPAARGTRDGVAVPLVRETILLALLASVGILSLRLDLALLGGFVDLRAAGLFQTALRWVEIGFVLPYALMLATFPTLAATADPRGELRRALPRFAGAAVVGTAVVVVAARLAVPRLYPESGGEIAGLVFWLLPAIPAVAAGTLFGQALVARERTSAALATAGLALAVHALAGLALVPGFGVEGAAVALVAAEIAGGTAALLAARRLVPGPGQPIAESPADGTVG